MEHQVQSQYVQTCNLDVWFQNHQMSYELKPNHSISHVNRTTNYRRDFQNSIVGETFFERYLKDLHGENNVWQVDGEEQRDNHRGDFILEHEHDGRKEFEVKLERKGAKTARHAMEFGEYHTDYLGNIQNERAGGWFTSSKADIIVPVVPFSDGTVVLYPYSLKQMRNFLAIMASNAERDGCDIRDECGKPDKEKMLDVLSFQIENSIHSLGPVNTLKDGKHKRSRSLCIPYEFMARHNLTKSYTICFE